MERKGEEGRVNEAGRGKEGRNCAMGGNAGKEEKVGV